MELCNRRSEDLGAWVPEGEDWCKYFDSIACRRRKGHRGVCLHYPYEARFYKTLGGTYEMILIRNGLLVTERFAPKELREFSKLMRVNGLL